MSVDAVMFALKLREKNVAGLLELQAPVLRV